MLARPSPQPAPHRFDSERPIDPLETERAIYQAYDDQRRLLLARGIAAAFLAILLSFLGLLNVFAVWQLTHGSPFFVPERVTSTLLLTDPILALCCLAFIGALVAIRRRHVVWACGITIAATNIAVITIELTWSFGLSGYDYVAVGAFVSLSLAIILAGVLGGRRSVILSTLLMNGVTIFVGFFSTAPHPRFEQDTSIAELARSQNLLTIPGQLLVQWAIAAVMLTTVLGYRRILHELGDVRIAYERARQLDQMKDLFISSVNHELRTPIMAVQGYVELLRLSDATLTAERRRSLIDHASSAADQLVELVETVLGVRQLERDAIDLKLSTLSPREVILSAIQLIDPREGLGPTRDLQLAIPEELRVIGDPSRLQQILLNLLNNALKYSDPGTPIAISVSAFGPRASPGDRRDLIAIHVRDYGYGVPPEAIPLLFQKFARLPRDLASTTQGSGLGLYLSRLLVEAMGGTIWIESSGEMGKGSIISFTLPKA